MSMEQELTALEESVLAGLKWAMPIDTIKAKIEDRRKDFGKCARLKNEILNLCKDRNVAIRQGENGTSFEPEIARKYKLLLSLINAPASRKADDIALAQQEIIETLGFGIFNPILFGKEILDPEKLPTPDRACLITGPNNVEVFQFPLPAIFAGYGDVPGELRKSLRFYIRHNGRRMRKEDLQTLQGRYLSIVQSISDYLGVFENDYAPVIRNIHFKYADFRFGIIPRIWRAFEGEEDRFLDGVTRAEEHDFDDDETGCGSTSEEVTRAD